MTWFVPVVTVLTVMGLGCLGICLNARNEILGLSMALGSVFAYGLVMGIVVAVVAGT